MGDHQKYRYIEGVRVIIPPLVGQTPLPLIHRLIDRVHRFKEKWHESHYQPSQSSVVRGPRQSEAVPQV